jgi:tetratricopeptide (TPR) repeat protein
MSHRFKLLNSIILSALIIAFGISGCGEEEPEGPTAEEITNEGWALYTASDYAGALAKFDEAISEDSAYVDAHVGMGWSYGRMTQLADCISSFQAALAKDAQNADALAGIALAYLANDEYDQAITNANQVLAINPSYSFAHGNVTSRNLRILLAESYYYKGDFENAQSQVDILNPGNGLNPADEDYLAGLLKEIEKASE